MVVLKAEMIVHQEVNSSGMTTNMDNQNAADNNNSDQNQNHGGAESNNNRGNDQAQNYGLSNLGRQSSIYSLTLDEFQHTLCENGKNFGSMNMDEFLNSIWTAEENQAHHHHDNPNTNIPGHTPAVGEATSGASRGLIAKQPSLSRQGSLTLPAPLCRKTVDEVWTEIHRSQQQDEQHQSQHAANANENANSNTTQRQPTFGEMTLEDFLVKAGVVREQGGPGATLPMPMAVVPPGAPSQHHHQQYGFANPHPPMGPSFVARPMMGMAPGGYQAMPTGGGETSGYAGNGKRNNGYAAQAVAPSVACYGGRVSNGGAPPGGFGVGLSPVSPVSPEAMCGPGQVDNSVGQYGLDMATLRGRKRIIDGPVEKVVERRQRRMIKNRESAARSRARKQAYTVELEAELNQLREENAQLKQALAELERQRKQQYFEEQKQVIASRAQRAQDKLKTMRRSLSCAV